MAAAVLQTESENMLALGLLQAAESTAEELGTPVHVSMWTPKAHANVFGEMSFHFREKTA